MTLTNQLRHIVTTNTENKFDLNEINIEIANNIEALLDKLNIHYIPFQNRVTLSCVYHSGTKDTSLNIFRDYGNVVCWTRHCEVNHGKSVLRLLSYILNTNITNTIEWVESVLNKKFSSVNVNEPGLSFKRFVAELNKKPKIHTTVSRDYVRKTLEIPSKRFLKRGFSESVLVEYDVGFCNTRGKEMYLRDTVPIYSENDFVIGAIGRTIYSECSICGNYHSSNKMCPTDDTASMRLASKWINSSGFSTGSYLYNWAVAKKELESNNTLNIVEGCGDCFRLIESGFRNCVGLFGCRITDEQKILLESANIKNINLCLDNDDAGREGTEKAIKELSRYYNLNIVVPSLHDWGEMKCHSIQKELGAYNG